MTATSPFCWVESQGSVSVTMPVTVNPDGTMASATVADAGAVTVTSCTPYGQLRGADNLALDRGWLGQVEDRTDATTGTGLTYLNARYYDPVLARFITPDPFRDLGNPQSFDGYAYSFNNPVVFIDASGLFPSICIPMPPNGSNCRTPGQMVSSGYDPQSVLTAGAVDGSVTAVLETGYSLTPEGVSENWRSFNASVDDQGLGMTLMSGGASAMGVDAMASMGQCASSLMCMGTSQGQYGFGQDAGSFGTRYTMFASTAIVGSGSTTLASSSSRPSWFAQRLARFRTANPSSDTVVIGRQMDAWVIPQAQSINAGYYKGTPILLHKALEWRTPGLAARVGMALNKAWIKAQIRAQKTIIDVDQDPSVELAPSPFLEMERAQTRTYPRYRSWE